MWGFRLLNFQHSTRKIQTSVVWKKVNPSAGFHSIILLICICSAVLLTVCTGESTEFVYGEAEVRVASNTDGSISPASAG